MDFDRDELLIAESYSAFEQNTDVPDLMAGVRKKLDVMPRTRRPVRLAVIMAAVIALLAITAAAATGSFDWLLNTVDPAFGETVEAVELSDEDEGIAMTVIAARRFGGSALFYVAIEDTTGQGRITDDMEPAIRAGSGSLRTAEASLIYFDGDNDRAVFEVTLELSGADSEPGVVTLDMNYYTYNHERLDVELTDFDLASAVQNGETVGEPVAAVSDIEIGTYLPTGYLTGVPGTDIWISAAGVNSGFTTVQLCWPGTGDTALYSSPSVTIMRDGQPVSNFQGRGSALTGELEPASDMREIEYRTLEAYFENVRPDQLEGCTLVVRTRKQDAVQGNWSVDVDFDHAVEPLTVTADITVEGRTVSGVTLALSPISLRISGTDPENILEGPHATDAVIETEEGTIHFIRGQSDRIIDTGEFSAIAFSALPIDPDSVTAIIIGDTRIEIE